MRERRSVQLVRRAHHLAIECRRCILHQRDVIAELHREAGRRLDASVRQQTDHDDVFDAVLFELLIEIGVGKAALGPMLLDDDVAFLGHEVRMPFTAPGSFGKSLPFTRGDLAWVRVSPLSVITRLPAMVRHDEELNLCSAHCRNDPAQMIEKVFFLGDLFEQGPKLAAFAEKIIVGVDEQQAGSVCGIVGCSHMIFFLSNLRRAPRSSSAALIASFRDLSSQIEYKNLSVIERLELQRAFFADSRAIACVQ